MCMCGYKIITFKLLNNFVFHFKSSRLDWQTTAPGMRLLRIQGVVCATNLTKLYLYKESQHCSHLSVPVSAKMTFDIIPLSATG